ncbi:putative metal-dependent hydrolase [Candidatus Kinetoplastibacterium desouzaii TCC079E]|uniref:Endoribonuclease YbeY n=1 Tax=Candidatus Kinetoplastidibacterium desouzai TCC079E TaxID=1208919 RepID=M1LLP5_9PROT|nr:rRNA maturation RNase YbeY [Candidatus Kinetoplastibacterium desouzaii]AGF46672.1 putative metal-dependent hydrolase [Candidatus Kinetoplastibacterium desouzaii TCC079E]
MKQIPKIILEPKLSLSIQYILLENNLPRWLIRRWVSHSIKLARNFISKELKKVILTIRFVDETEGKELNKLFRGKNYATNILTFPYGIENEHLSADLVVCLPIIHKEAQEQNKIFSNHAAHIIIHGVLHALGFDHETETETIEMEQLEIAILKNMKIENPYKEIY